ncbi:L-rhamnose mutarotase [Chitinophaga polysaccharea]|nr:L-rhamnose mutarotase [Chitinophaga polysaccharea]
MMKILLLAAGILLAVSCSVHKSHSVEKVFVVNIKPGEENLQAYLNYHQHIWPEVEAGFRKAGYEDIRLFRSEHTVVMIVTVPEGADLDAMGKKAEASHPRCAEWNRLMAGYQEGVTGTSPGQTWSAMEPLYHFSGSR